MAVAEQKIPYCDAWKVAVDVASHLFDDDVVLKYDVAGSVRRQRPEVSDIELVCLAKRYPTSRDLFGEPQGWTVPLEGRIAEWMERGRFSPREKSDGTVTMGPKCKYLWYHSNLFPFNSPYKLDLFIVHDPRQYGLILAIRTGPEQFSQKLVSRRAPFGKGFLARGWKVDGGWLYDSKGEPQDTASEKKLFELVGIPNIEPEDRDEFAAAWDGGAR